MWYFLICCKYGFWLIVSWSRSVIYINIQDDSVSKNFRFYFNYANFIPEIWVDKTYFILLFISFQTWLYLPGPGVYSNYILQLFFFFYFSGIIFQDWKSLYFDNQNFPDLLIEGSIEYEPGPGEIFKSFIFLFWYLDRIVYWLL